MRISDWSSDVCSSDLKRLYYETMENVLSNVDKTIIEARGVTPYLPLNEVQKRLKAPDAASKGGACSSARRSVTLSDCSSYRTRSLDHCTRRGCLSPAHRRRSYQDTADAGSRGT